MELRILINSFLY